MPGFAVTLDCEEGGGVRGVGVTETEQRGRRLGLGNPTLMSLGKGWTMTVR